jgi:hypothetical protein
VPSLSTRGRWPLPRMPCAWHTGKGPLPRVPSAWHSWRMGTIFYFFVFLPHFFEAFPYYLKLLAQIWLTFEFVCYISLVFSFSWIFRHNSNLNYMYMKSYNLAIQKMIFIIFGVYWGLIHQLTWNIEHLVVVTWLTTYGKSVSELQKIRTKSEKHETCRNIVLSHVEVVCNSWEDFEQVAMCDAWNPDISTGDQCDNTLGDVWVLGIRRRNLLEIFSILTHNLYMW